VGLVQEEAGLVDIDFFLQNAVADPILEVLLLARFRLPYNGPYFLKVHMHNVVSRLSNLVR